MKICEIKGDKKYYANELLENCLNDDKEIDFDKALKKILSNTFIYFDYGWVWGIDLRDNPEIFISSDNQYTKEDLVPLIDFVKFVVETAKKEKNKTYLEYSKLFDQLIDECEDYWTKEDGCGDVFSIEIFEGIDLNSTISEEYRQHWVI
jgi:hypothetical protein